MRKLTLDVVKKYVGHRGVCLSERYVNNHTKLLWKCNRCGNVWKAAFNNVKFGKWCPQCAGCKKLSIKDMTRIALDRNGKCLSKNYSNAYKKLKWECNVCGNVWRATPHNIKSGTWCPRCSKREKLNISKMRALAKSKNGKCLSRSYKNINTKLLWSCNKCGDVWETAPYNIKLGTWCPRCAGTKKKSIEDMKKLAQSMGGECLSKEYINCYDDLLWKCGVCRFTWKATPNNVRRGTWCPYCIHKSENFCRKIIEGFFNAKFTKIRPLWLRNTVTNKKMELDGFNEKLKIAFEYNGQQHYSFTPPFHASIEDLKEGIQRDRLKRRLCKKNGVLLITIPPLNTKYRHFPSIEKAILKKFITDQLSKVKYAGRNI